MKIHFTGADGISMTLLKNLTQSYGHEVTGSDILSGGHDKNNVRGCDLVVYSGAVRPDNEELVEAARLRIPVMERSAYLGRLSGEFERVIAIAGSHGKTTATAMTYRALERQAPTLHIGGRMDHCKYIGGDRLLITEACEYRRSFLYLRPAVGVVLNAELDHTDYYEDLADILSAFAGFIENSKLALINGDDKNLSCFRGETVMTFGLAPENDFYADAVEAAGGGTRFSLKYRGAYLGDVFLCVPGLHNVYNATAAAACGILCGATFDETTAALTAFRGVHRRFELLGEAGGAKIYTDYAHHPTEIRATLGAVARTQGAEVWTVFEPHTFSRTRDLFSGFVDSLSGSDHVVLAPVFRSRESGGAVGSRELYLALEGRCYAALFDSYEAINAYVRANVKPGDTVIYMGAGDIDRAAEMLLCLEKKRSPQK
ncbi:MAG: UDP-N-acetylmuramate--L-alanine ligase [Clostridiales bacterium]|jgi:UDP-N-acetylmuramate--alanine ligase|nr:UDP-N-acetylmuramate--L-alanine ligase [Clostridiales bacterium]